MENNINSEIITCGKCIHFIPPNNDAPKCDLFTSFYVCGYETCPYAIKTKK